MGPGRNIGVVLDPMVCLRLIGYPLNQGFGSDSICS
jgi:hypothetical protein